MPLSDDPLEWAKNLLRPMIASSLGDSRVAELLNGIDIRVFNSYLLQDVDTTPPKASYEGRVFSSRSGVQYFRPDGWVQVYITASGDDPDFVDMRDWPVAYHGTDSSNIGPILEAGLRKPGELPSVQIAHGQAGAGVEGAVYATPSLWLASHPVYSSFRRISASHWAQFVFKVRIRPGSYRLQASTLSNSRHWDSELQMDPNIQHNQALEYIVPDSKDVMVVGLMIREFGALADEHVFGKLARSVTDTPSEEAHYFWTRRLQEMFQSGGFRIDNGITTVGRCVGEWVLEGLSHKREIYDGYQCIRSPMMAFPDKGVSEFEFVFAVARGNLNVKWRCNKVMSCSLDIEGVSLHCVFPQAPDSDLLRALVLEGGGKNNKKIPQAPDDPTATPLGNYAGDAPRLDRCEELTVALIIHKTVLPDAMPCPTMDGHTLWWSLDAKQWGLVEFRPGARITSPKGTVDTDYGTYWARFVLQRCTGKWEDYYQMKCCGSFRHYEGYRVRLSLNNKTVDVPLTSPLTTLPSCWLHKQQLFKFPWKEVTMSIVVLES